MRLFILALFVLLVSFIIVDRIVHAIPVQALTTSQYCQEPVETDMVRLINQYRAANGVGPVQADQILSTAAEHHAIDMGQRNILDHNLADGTDFGQNIYNHGWTKSAWFGEDAAGSYSQAIDILHAWENSPGHNAILLDPKYIAVGVGRYDDGGVTQARYWWIADFASAFDTPVVVCSGGTVTPTQTNTLLATDTAKMVPSPTRTVTTIPSATPTVSATSTASATPTSSVTSTLTATNTPFVTSTPGATSTPKPTRSPKACPTRNPHYPAC